MASLLKTKKVGALRDSVGTYLALFTLRDLRCSMQASSPGRVAKPGAKSSHPKQRRVPRALSGHTQKQSNATPSGFGSPDEERSGDIPGKALASVFSLSSEVSVPATEGISPADLDPGTICISLGASSAAFLTYDYGSCQCSTEC